MPATSSVEGQVFPNLVPTDVARPYGFTAVSPSQIAAASGRFNYVVPADSRLVIANRRHDHINLANGADAIAAGEVRVVNGQVVSIKNASGHYRQSCAGAQAVAEKAFESSELVVRAGAYKEIE